MKLTLKAVVVCALLFAAYHVAVKRLPGPLRTGAGSQPERNLMRAQAYFYTRGDPPVVVVGSSIAERLRNLPRDWYALAFPGGNAVTGLEIIARSGKRPRFVLIETNVLNLDPDEQMLESLTVPVLADARRKLPALLEESKPTHVAVRALTRGDAKPKPAAAAEAAGVSPEFFAALVRRRLAELADPVPPTRLDVIAGRLRRDVDVLEARGTRVVFFEAPELPEAAGTPLKQSLRDRLRDEFPPSRYLWVPAAQPTSYRTSDAVHLTPESAARYCDVLAAYIGALDPGGERRQGMPLAGAPSTAPAQARLPDPSVVRTSQAGVE